MGDTIRGMEVESMPWKIRCPLDERMLFVSRIQTGESVSELCREFGISRKTAYKFINRYEKQGPAGLHDVSRRPFYSPNQTPIEIRELIVQAKREKPTWGAAKLREWLLRKHPGIKIPSRFTVHEILNKYELVNHRTPRRRGSPYFQASCLAKSTEPNEIWCTDFKGQFRLGNQKYCYPLTISDHYSRYLIACEGLEDTKAFGAKAACEIAFREFGLPRTILSDNGVPFASMGLFGLSKLSVWWMRLGIKPRRIEPGHPEQNGRHERMHLTLKLDTTRPAGANFLQQQEKFDSFKEIYNQERPHEAIEMKCPAMLYQSSPRPYPESLPELRYPLHDVTKNVGADGKLRVQSKVEFHLSDALAHQPVGLREEDNGLWRITFMNMDLGLYDVEEHKFKPFANPSSTTEI